VLPNWIATFAQYDNDSQFFGILLSNFVSFAGLQIVSGCFFLFCANWIARKVLPTAEETTAGASE
jgi:hypothetical protein